jgi:hypothetical protein
MTCVAFAWAAWINMIDFMVRRLAESASISGADIDFWRGLNQLDFWWFEIPLFIWKLYDATSFPGLQCEDEARHEEALVWAGLFCILIG